MKSDLGTNFVRNVTSHHPRDLCLTFISIVKYVGNQINRLMPFSLTFTATKIILRENYYEIFAKNVINRYIINLSLLSTSKTLSSG